jgi:hypothetical protein
MPASRTSVDSNVIAERRSFKAMQAALRGIPIVTPSWISACLDAKKVVAPESNHYIRSLPTKTKSAEESQNFGVAFRAATIDYDIGPDSGKHAPLCNAFVYLCGFSTKKEGDFGLLCREAGAKEVTTNKSVALSKAKNLTNSPECKFVLLCDNSNVRISDRLEREIRKNKDQVLVVNSHWLFDSISCGMALPSHQAYKPQGEKTAELWQVTSSVSLG